MLELSLFSQIPSSRHQQVLQILAGIAAMPPNPTLERHIVFRPIKQPIRVAAQVGGSQGIQDAQKAARQAQAQGQGDMYYLRLVEDLTMAEMDDNATDADVAAKSRWTLHFYDVPDAGRKELKVMTRSCSMTPVLEGDVIGFMQGLGYQFVNQYVIQGHQVVHSHLVMHLHRMLLLPNTDAGPLRDLQNEHLDPHDLAPLDVSGGYTLQAYVYLRDGSSYDLIQQGASELLRLKELLRGSVDLRLLENRLSLDTRVR